jgi:Protein of unknown function (DUF3096)
MTGPSTPVSSSRPGVDNDAARRCAMTTLVAAGTSINLHLTLPGIIALIAGILILIFPTILNYVVAAYLILVGLILIFNFHI